MKRFFILASAAIVALASCAKTEVVHNGEQQEIAFKAVTGSVTKSEQSGTLTETMGVFAVVHGGSSDFDNVSFSKDATENYWTGTEGEMYWPVNHKLDFVVYSPFVNGSEFTANKLTVATDNSANVELDNQIDYLYGAEYYDDTDAGYDKDTEYVPVTLKHAQAKVTVSFDIANVTVTNVKLTAPVLQGSFVVDYSSTTPSIDWTPGSANSAVELIASTDIDEEASLLVVPKTKTNITFNYQIKGSDVSLPYEINVTDTWAAGKHYTYNVSITPKEIKFTPTVAVWDEDVTGTPSTTL